jgi:Uma2 family endonuclease
MTMAEFLELPEEKPYREYLRGEVCEKAMPNRVHGELVIELGSLLRNYLRETDEGRVATEVRNAYQAGDWVFLPDLQVTLSGRLSRSEARGPVEVIPNLCIEVLSPDDRASKLFERVELYMRAGTRLLWVVDPEAETITAYRPGEVAIVHRGGAVMGAAPVLRDFKLDVGRLFEVVRDA